MIAAETPAQHVLEGYLRDCLRNPADHRDEYELQLDILYLLTDKIAHRRALSAELILRELSQIRPSDLHLELVDSERLKQVLRPLIQQRLVRQYESMQGEGQYELAHDFLVRSVLKAWRQLDRERTEQLAILRQEREKVEERLTRLAWLEGTANRTLQLLPVLVFGLVIWLAYLGFNQELPKWLGLSVLWLIICPAVVIIFMASARRTHAGVLFGILTIATCAGIRWYEQTLQSIPIDESAPRYVYASRQCETLLQSIAGDLRVPVTIMQFGVRSNCEDLLPSIGGRSDEEDQGWIRLRCRRFATATAADLQPFRGKTDSFENDLMSRCQGFITGINSVARLPGMPTPTLRPFQIGELAKGIGPVALALGVFLLSMYPKILLDTSTLLRDSEHARWVVTSYWAELIDVVATLVLLIAGIASSDKLDLITGPGTFWLALTCSGIIISIIFSSSGRRETPYFGRVDSGDFAKKRQQRNCAILKNFCAATRIRCLVGFECVFSHPNSDRYSDVSSVSEVSSDVLRFTLRVRGGLCSTRQRAEDLIGRVRG